MIPDWQVWAGRKERRELVELICQLEEKNQKRAMPHMKRYVIARETGNLTRTTVRVMAREVKEDLEKV